EAEMRITRYIFASMAAMIVSVASVTPAAAAAAADLQRFYFEYAFADVGGGECLAPGTVGTVTGTVTASAQDLINPTGFHNRRTTTLEYLIDFPDDSYVIGTAVEHATINLNFQNSQIINTIAI